jgi:dethiobiotin synthetase
MNKGIFITGTDTGVGKTFIAASLLRIMKEQGLRVCPMKPVETGCKSR